MDPIQRVSLFIILVAPYQKKGNKLKIHLNPIQKQGSQIRIYMNPNQNKSGQLRMNLDPKQNQSCQIKVYHGSILNKVDKINA
jgi:hypothetical protein